MVLNLIFGIYVKDFKKKKSYVMGLYPDFSYYSEDILKLSPRKEILENKKLSAVNERK